MPLSDAQAEALGRAVIALLGVDENDEVAARAHHAVGLMVTLVMAYTRNNGFHEGVDGHLVIAEPLQAVIITAACRLATNPQQSESESESAPLLRTYGAGGFASSSGTGPIEVPGTEHSAGFTVAGQEGQGAVIGAHSFAFSGGFHGWTPVETAVLHQYRKRAG